MDVFTDAFVGGQGEGVTGCMAVVSVTERLKVSGSAISHTLSKSANGIGTRALGGVLRATKQVNCRHGRLTMGFHRRDARGVNVVVPRVIAAFCVAFVGSTRTVLHGRKCGIVVTVSGRGPRRRERGVLVVRRLHISNVLVDTYSGRRGISLCGGIVRENVPVIFFSEAIRGMGTSRIRVSSCVVSFFVIRTLLHGNCGRVVRVPKPTCVQGDCRQLENCQSTLRGFRVRCRTRSILSPTLSTRRND